MPDCCGFWQFLEAELVHPLVSPLSTSCVFDVAVLVVSIHTNQTNEPIGSHNHQQTETQQTRALGVGYFIDSRKDFRDQSQTTANPAIPHFRHRLPRQKRPRFTWIFKTTPVGFEPTQGDPIGLAGRRLSHSAKVSLTQLHVSNLRCNWKYKPRRHPIRRSDLTKKSLHDCSSPLWTLSQNGWCHQVCSKTVK